MKKLKQYAQLTVEEQNKKHSEILKELRKFLRTNPSEEELNTAVAGLVCNGAMLHMITNPERNVKIQYLKNYDLKNWGELKYEYEGDSGFDLRAAIDKSIILGSIFYSNPIGLKDNFLNDSHHIQLIPCGIKVELPINYELQIRPRSGLALKYGITVLNTPGTVDRTFRGEIGVILTNLGTSDITIKPGDRIAQAVINKIPSINLVKTKQVKLTKRNHKGFGSTGKK